MKKINKKNDFILLYMKLYLFGFFSLKILLKYYITSIKINTMFKVMFNILYKKKNFRI
jgi:hypothetical protein